MNFTQTRNRFLSTASLLALAASAFPWSDCWAQVPGQVPEDEKKKKKKREPQPEDDPRFDCGRYWVAELGSSKAFSETPCLTTAEFKDYAGNLMEKERIYVRRERQDPQTLRWIVLSAVCTHLRCRVEYSDYDGHYVCPCHGSEFDLEGEVLRKPAKRPLPDYSELVLWEEGELFLRREATRKSPRPEAEPENPPQTPPQTPR